LERVAGTGCLPANRFRFEDFMRFTAVRAGLALALLNGCVGPVATAPLPASHPANPAAPEAPMPPASSTLAIDDKDSGPLTPGARPATTAVAGLYACPMHPDVTSRNPNDRCPKCGMRINKPVTATTAPATRPAAAPDHAGHSGAGHTHAEHDGGNK
jgi:hypothetical protein